MKNGAGLFYTHKHLSFHNTLSVQHIFNFNHIKFVQECPVRTEYINPLYTDTRYNDKIHYSDNLTDTKPSLKR